MNVNQKIETALSDMVSGNIWPLNCPLENKPDIFIVYEPEKEIPDDFGDDQEGEWIHQMAITLVCASCIRIGKFHETG